MKYVGVDGTPDGWLAIIYDDNSYEGRTLYSSVDRLWEDHHDAETILIDVPIGLREECKKARPCDDEARGVLSPNRYSSVFPTPVRAVLDATSYEEAKAIQEEKTDGSLGVQTWGITPKIAELDEFLRGRGEAATETIREAHPEVCFWALNGETPTQYSKTGQPTAAFCERVAILEAVDEHILDAILAAGTDLDSDASPDDLLDSFVLAVTASTLTGPYQTLPEEDTEDPKSLPMEMVYSYPL